MQFARAEHKNKPYKTKKVEVRASSYSNQWNRIKLQLFLLVRVHLFVGQVVCHAVNQAHRIDIANPYTIRNLNNYWCIVEDGTNPSRYQHIGNFLRTASR